MGDKIINMQAFHNNLQLKQEVLQQLASHKEKDEIVKEQYWIEEKGCAVGCLTHDINGGHKFYPEKWGIPIELAYLEDAIFEGLEINEAKEWPEKFMNAIPVGADLSKVWAQFALYLITDMKYGIQSKCNDNAVSQVIQVVIRYLNDTISGNNSQNLKDQINSYIQNNLLAFNNAIAWVLRFIVLDKPLEASFYAVSVFKNTEKHYKWQADILIDIISKIQIKTESC